MDKNWLIRTKSNHILGPVSKEKVLELYHNGSIQPDDEVCSGNGYWFYIREKDLVERFLLGSELQGFNPLSEGINNNLTNTTGGSEDKSEGTTLITNVDPSLINRSHEQSSILETDLEHNENQKKEIFPSTQKFKSNQFKENTPAINDPSVKNNKKQLWLKYLGIIGFIFLFLLIYFRKSILQQFLKSVDSQSTFYFIESAYAEETEIKKKTF